MSFPDTLENGGEPRPALRWIAIALAVALVVVVVIVTILRSAQRREDRSSFGRLLTLSAAGQAAVERAQSEVRDTAQYAEPLLNSSLTTQDVREGLYVSVSASAQQAQTDVDTQVQRLQAAHTGGSGRLRAARAATLAYLSDWSSLLASAAGGGDLGSQADIDALQLAARTALEKAAPDHQRAVQASKVFGVSAG